MSLSQLSNENCGLLSHWPSVSMKKSVAVTLRKIQIFFFPRETYRHSCAGTCRIPSFDFPPIFFYFLNLSNVPFSVTGPGAAVDHGAPTSQRISLRANFNFFQIQNFTLVFTIHWKLVENNPKITAHVNPPVHYTSKLDFLKSLKFRALFFVSEKSSVTSGTNQPMKGQRVV